MLSDLLEKTTPKYSCKLPISGKTVWYRPFFVREEKMLLLAIEENSSRSLAITMAEIIKNCCEEINSPNSMFFSDAIYLFLKIRSKSVSESIESTIISEGQEIEIELDLESGIGLEGSKQKPKIELAKNLMIEMREPILQDYIDVEFNNDLTGHYELISRCIKTVSTTDTDIETNSLPTEEVIEFVEKLNRNQFKKVVDFITNSPKVFLQTKYIIDGEEKNLKIESIFDFFAFPSAT